jgi:RNA polymerase sigma-70 factor (ECF subfamily)
VRLCLDTLKSARQNRETYLGPWLPEPVPAEPADEPLAESRIDELESLSMAFLLILETLSPLERAAFLLREVFEYDFDEVAAALGRSSAACRQLFHRAQEHVEARKPRYRVKKSQHLQILQAFVAATSSGDVAQLSRLLCDDVVATSDANGETRAARKTVFGRDRVSRFLIGVAKHGAADTQFVPAWLNGCPALMGSVGGELRIAILLENNGEQVTAIRFVLASAKLRWLRRAGESIA